MLMVALELKLQVISEEQVYEGREEEGEEVGKEDSYIIYTCT